MGVGQYKSGKIMLHILAFRTLAMSFSSIEQFAIFFTIWLYLFIFSFYFRLFDLQLVDKVCQCWDSNRGYLVSEATALPTEPPPLPHVCNVCAPK